MPIVRHSVTIDRPLAEVSRFVVDQTKIQQWQLDVRQIYHPEESMRPGIILSHDRATRIFHWRLDLNADVTDYRPNKLIAYQGALGQFRAKGKIEFEGHGRSAIVTETVDIRMGCLMFWLSPFMSAVMGRRTRKTLERLKIVLETPGSDKTAEA